MELWKDEKGRDAGLLRVRQSLQRVDGKLALEELKTARSRRTIDLPTFCATAVREQKERQAFEERLARDEWRGNADNLAFTTPLGTPIEPRNLVRHFKQSIAATNKAGKKQAEEQGAEVHPIPELRLYDLRHCAASYLLAAGISPRVVMEILGHSQFNLTMNTYAHVMPTLRKEAANAMDELLSGEAASG